MAFAPLPSPADVEILTTIRWDEGLRQFSENNAWVPSKGGNSCYMLSYHRDRMLAAAQALHWPLAIQTLSGDSGFAGLKGSIERFERGYHYYTCATKTRVMLSRSGSLSVTMSGSEGNLPYRTAFPQEFSISPPLSTQAWRIQLSPVSIPVTLYTQHKTTLRSHYDFVRSHLPRDNPKVEVLLMNPTGEIMEGSLATPYFFRNGKWITPAKECGGNQGTTRRWALEKGLCQEGIVRADELRNLEVVWLSNGFRGFEWGFLEIQPMAPEVKTE